jgi:hypothetical protein
VGSFEKTDGFIKHSTATDNDFLSTALATTEIITL